MLSLLSAVLWPPPTPLSRIFWIFGVYLISLITQQVKLRQVEVSFVPPSSFYTSHPLYPEFLSWLRMIRSSTKKHGLRLHSKDSAKPPYTVLPQQKRTADIYEAEQRFTFITGCIFARAHELGLGPRLSGIAPVFQSPSTRMP